MLDICLLGTGGMLPLPNRWLTALMVKYNGVQLLIDSGEGTQIAIKKKGISVKPIDILCITHFHADHISGLPGLLLSMGNAQKESPLLIIGPAGVEKVVKSLRIIAPELPFEIKFHELTQQNETIFEAGYEIEAFKVNHAITCYGYNIKINRAGKFDAEKAKVQGIPLKFWKNLQNGETVEDGDNVYTPDMVMGPERKGLKVTYATDTRPVQSIADAAKDADLFICEGMYGEEDKIDKVKAHKHMLMSEGAFLAAKANPKEMWFTHYSPAMLNPQDYIEDVKKIFPNAKAAKDGWSKTLKFSDEE